MQRVIPPSVKKMVADASTDAGSEVDPFWLSDSEGVPEEGMYLLAAELDLPNTEQVLAGLPIGYRVVFSIFAWEQSRAGEGFATGIENSGTELLAAAADSYEIVGMSEEADALREVLVEHARAPGNYQALNAAYCEGKPNPYRDDWSRIPHLVRVLCAGAEAYFYAEAEA